MSRHSDSTRMSRKERREAEARAARRRHALASAGLTGDAAEPGARRSLRVMAEAAAFENEVIAAQIGRPRLRFALAVTFTCAAAWAAASLGTPATGRAWDPAALGAGSVMVLAGLGWIRGASTWVSRRAKVTAASIAAVLAVAFTLGALTQPYLGGEPVISSSEKARAYRLSERIRDDLYRMAELDELLAYDAADARAHLDEYPASVIELRELSRDYAALERSDLPNEAFVTIVRAVKASANSGAMALEAKASITVEYDIRGEQQMQLHRGSFITEALRAGNELSVVAGNYGIVISREESGAVE